MKVDLITSSRVLEDLMLSEYDGKIFGNQIGKVGERKARRYIFMDLNYEKLSKFLRERAKYASFVIAVNEPEKVH